MTVVENRYLEGNFAPVTEELTATDLPSPARSPSRCDGRFLRNGPNPVGAVDPATYHWFGGEGMVHGVRLADGKADWYRNRWVRAGRVLTEPARARPGRRDPQRHGLRGEHERDRPRGQDARRSSRPAVGPSS